MIIVMGRITLVPGAIDRLQPDIAALLGATHAEDGCETYTYARDVLDPDTLRVAERWRDEAALVAHLSAPHVAAFGPVLRAAGVVSIDFKAFDTDGERAMPGR
jgi:quinol monooxygenase YgiN